MRIGAVKVFPVFVKYVCPPVDPRFVAAKVIPEDSVPLTTPL
jgi:hypothetical protein